jgi:hypothetical protein
VIEGVRRKPSVALASWVSALVCIGVGVLITLALGVQPFMLLWLVLFTFQNIARARAGAAPAPPPPPKAEGEGDVAKAFEEVRTALQQRDFDTALAAATKLETAGGPYRQAAALRLRAGIELARGDNEAAALFAGQSFSLWQTPDAAVVAARASLRSGQEDRARNWLRRALEAGAPIGAVRNDPELGAITT